MQELSVYDVIERFGFEPDDSRSYGGPEYEVEFYNLNGFTISVASFGDYTCYNVSGAKISLQTLIELINKSITNYNG